MKVLYCIVLYNNNEVVVHGGNSISTKFSQIFTPGEFGESLNSGNSYFTKNWSRRLLIRILARTSLTKEMRVSEINSGELLVRWQYLREMWVSGAIFARNEGK